MAIFYTENIHFVPFFLSYFVHVSFFWFCFVIFLCALSQQTHTYNNNKKNAIVAFFFRIILFGSVCQMVMHICKCAKQRSQNGDIHITVRARAIHIFVAEHLNRSQNLIVWKIHKKEWPKAKKTVHWNKRFNRSSDHLFPSLHLFLSPKMILACVFAFFFLFIYGSVCRTMIVCFDELQDVNVYYSIAAVMVIMDILPILSDNFWDHFCTINSNDNDNLCKQFCSLMWVLARAKCLCTRNMKRKEFLLSSHWIHMHVKCAQSCGI